MRHRERLPITPDILYQMFTVWKSDSQNPDVIMMWAACCTCFFGFLRAGEITLPSQKDYDSGAHLRFGDVKLDAASNPTRAEVSIKSSKTDPFRHGVVIHLGKTDNALCPVVALASYLAIRGSSSGPFFKFKDGSFLTRARFVSEVSKVLSAAGIDSSKYSGHSFRIGAATTAAMRGLDDSLIQTLGRWESNSYLLYVRIPREQLATICPLYQPEAYLQIDC